MMGTGGNGQHFFPLTSLQIGDLQSYLSRLCLFLATESNKLYILVDNRPWLIHLDSRPAHLWQFMVTKSRLSPFANTKGQKERKGFKFKKKINFKGISRANISDIKKFEKWFALISAAALSQKESLLPVKKLRNAMLLNNELHRTLYGFIVFEVDWNDVRGMNYLNELQTDTSLALEAKLMKRWEFDSIEQASNCIRSWFSGTHFELVWLQAYLDSILGEVFHDAQEDFTNANCNGDCAKNCTKNGCVEDPSSPGGSKSEFSVYPAHTECTETTLQTPPPPTGPYKRRKITKSRPYEGGVDMLPSGVQSESIDSPKISGASPSPSSRTECTVEATKHRDVLILFRFNDHDLPFKLRQIIMSDLRLLTLLESGLPSWVIFLQSYPLFCHLYRPWMCPVARALYVLISVVTVVIGFYDLYKNVPVLKATVSSVFGPLFDWIETWEMLSRIKYLGTMLFLHNFEKAIKWFLMVTRSFKSFFSVLTQPFAGPLMELVEVILPFWNGCFQAVESFFTVIWVLIDSSCGLVMKIIQMLLSPLWFILSVIGSIVFAIVYPIIWAIQEILYTPIRLLLGLASFVAYIFSCIIESAREVWLFASSIFQLKSATEAGTYEISLWRSLWNDLFSQVFKAIRSIINGFVAFFVACNRHRLSIYNHMQEFFLRLSCLTGRYQTMNFNYRQRYGAQDLMQSRRKVQGRHPEQTPEKPNLKRYASSHTQHSLDHRTFSRTQTL
ncbi:hypothetical protein MKW94_024282 [Papaver nudicaule]|uniref:Uncharacterized protein n=1 Tax=Papaver nudicaule TaxID=74823 RepID=A0AA41S9G4_PAPNU|nr:hypothetical protein [Papaver nudicaule]